MNAGAPIAGSFRDPAAFLYRRNGVLLRQVTQRGARDLEILEESGLYRELVDTGSLVEHETVGRDLAFDPRDCAAVLRPREIATISYPYEWCFSQLKSAALLTLDLQDKALAKGMTLKDASAYNVQFEGPRPVFIDTLSFAPREDGAAWAGYRQFCQHFLGPLLLMAYTDVRLNSLLRTHLDGVPLDLASSLLPFRAKARPGVLAHLVSHAKMQQRYSDTSRPTESPGKSAKPVRKISLQSVRGLVASLRSLVASLDWKPEGTEWIDYYDANHNYSGDSLEEKESVVRALAEQVPRLDSVWDLGANTGRFSRILADRAKQIVSWDIDPACVEMHFRVLKKDGVSNILPLICDLTNPSPALGWAHEERDSFLGRSDADLALALGLVHHLAIGANVPLPRVMKTLRTVADRVIVEWIPRGDSQIDRLLSAREDVFDDYTEDGFLDAVGRTFEIVERRPLSQGSRELFLLASR